MTVDKLIEELKKLDPNKKVRYFGGEGEEDVDELREFLSSPGEVYLL
jgi:hypothetical protein